MICSPNSIPAFDGLGLPADIDIGLTPRSSNQSAEAMRVCCAPNPVHVVQNCTLWCELPPAFMERVGRSGEPIPWQLSQCFREDSGVNVSGVVVATGGHEAEESSSSAVVVSTVTPSVAGLGALVLLILWSLWQ